MPIITHFDDEGNISSVNDTDSADPILAKAILEDPEKFGFTWTMHRNKGKDEDTSSDSEEESCENDIENDKSDSDLSSDTDDNIHGTSDDDDDTDEELESQYTGLHDVRQDLYATFDTPGKRVHQDSDEDSEEENGDSSEDNSDSDLDSSRESIESDASDLEESESDSEADALAQEEVAMRRAKTKSTREQIDAVTAAVEASTTIDETTKNAILALTKVSANSLQEQDEHAQESIEHKRTVRSLKRAATSAKRSAKKAKREASQSRKSSYKNAPKGLTTPTFPATLVFNPDKGGQDDVIDFLEKFEEICAHVPTEYKTYYLARQLAPDVALVLRQHQKLHKKYKKSVMTYNQTRKWVISNYKKRDALSVAFAKLKTIKQGTSTVHSYVTKLQAQFSQIEEHGHVIDKLSRRNYLVDGLRARLRTKAKAWTDFYEMRASKLIRELSSLDESLKEADKASRATVSLASDSKVNKLEARIAQLEKEKPKDKGGSEEEVVSTVHKSKDKRSEQEKSLTLRNMEKYYSSEIFKSRLKFAAQKGDPRKHPEYYKNDKYEGKPACIFCKKIGHTMDTCHAWAKKHGK